MEEINEEDASGENRGNENTGKEKNRNDWRKKNEDVKKYLVQYY